MSTVSPVLTRQELRRLLGPVRAPGAFAAVLHEEVVCDGYVRRRVSYDVPSGRASAFDCTPDRLVGPAPLVFSHHQHNGEFTSARARCAGCAVTPTKLTRPSSRSVGS